MNISIEKLKKTVNSVLITTGLTESDIFVKKVGENKFRIPNGNITNETGLLNYHNKMIEVYEKKFKK